MNRFLIDYVTFSLGVCNFQPVVVFVLTLLCPFSSSWYIQNSKITRIITYCCFRVS